MEFSSLAFKKEHFKMCTCDEFVTLGLTDLINICKNKASLHNSLKFFPIQILIVFLRLDCHPILYIYSATDLKLGSCMHFSCSFLFLVFTKSQVYIYIMKWLGHVTRCCKSGPVFFLSVPGPSQ